MKGLTYLDKETGFSINEGEYPNIHVRWRKPYGLYIAICRWLKFSIFLN